MMHFISGDIVQIHPAFVVLESNGLGYGLHISLYTYTSIQAEKSCRLYTHLHVKNEGSSVSGIEMFGFHTEHEKDIFIKLISVSGIGVNTARMMLSSMQPDEIEKAILHANVAAIQAIKGIGPKTAQRAILELKDKIVQNGNKAASNSMAIQHMSKQDEALQALIALGIAKPMADKALSKIVATHPNSSLEEMIKLTLKNL